MFNINNLLSWRETKKISMFHKSVGAEKGFSLIELLVGIVIIGLLIAIIIPLDAAHKREAIKASVKSDVRNTNANIINSLNENPKADGFKLNDPSAGKPSSTTNGVVNVYAVISKGTKVVVTDVVTGDPSSATGDGSWDSYQVTGTHPDVPGFYYTFISTIGEYRSDDGVDPNTPPVVAGPNPTPTQTLAPAVEGIMVSTWDTSLPNCSVIRFKSSLTSAGATIDWGDGTVESGEGNGKIHTYTDTPGLKTITFKGKFAKYGGSLTDHTNTCLKRIDKWENTGTKDLSASFASSHNLEYFPNIPETVTDLSYAFYYTKNFQFDINAWDVSNVTTTESMFAGTNFNRPLNNWDVSNVTNMSSMFSTSDFNQPLNDWDVSNVTNMNRLFAATPFNQNIENWDVSNVTNMNSMFSGNKLYNQPVNSWNVSNVTDMQAMFRSAAKFNQPLNNWDVSNVTTMKFMLSTAKQFNQPLNNWDVSNVTDMNDFINTNELFNQDLSSWNVTKVGANHERFSISRVMQVEYLPRWVA